MPLSTPGMSMSLVTVASARALNATDNLWDAQVRSARPPRTLPGGHRAWHPQCHLSCTLGRQPSVVPPFTTPPPPGPPLFPPLQTGMPDDRLPEVPPDGNITLGFTYPVNLAMLQSALRIEGAPGASAQVGRGWAGHPWHARRARVCSPPGTSS